MLEDSIHLDMAEIMVSENGVYMLLLNLNPRKAAGQDGIPLLPPQSGCQRTCCSPDPSVQQLSSNRPSTPTMKTQAGPTHLPEGDRSQVANY